MCVRGKSVNETLKNVSKLLLQITDEAKLEIGLGRRTGDHVDGKESCLAGAGKKCDVDRL